MRAGRLLGLVWIALALRLAFYSTMLPLWEGYDEWAHFAVVRRAAAGELLVDRNATVPLDVEASLDLAPVPFEMRYRPAPAATEDVFWRLAEPQRAERAAAFAALPPEWQHREGRLKAYEALQPPLYYWLMAPALKLAGGADLGTQVMVLRWLSCLLASLAIPLVFLTGRAVFRDDLLAVGCAAVAAAMPGFALDVARVGNDCLAVVLFSALIWLTVERRPAWAIGVVLGLGLLTKAYFLAAIPALLVCEWRRVRRLAAIFGIAAAIAGWWYARNLLTTGTLAGLSESVMLRGTTAGEMVSRATHINWIKAIDGTLLSHLYFGGWSSLTARSWMYHVFYVAIAASGTGLLAGFFRSKARQAGRPVPLVAFYVCFWIGQLYNIALLHLSKGVAVSMGWYLYAVAGAEIVLCVEGLRRSRWALAGGVVLFSLLDLYTVHGLSLPYYSGIVAHKANGGIAGLHWADWGAFGGVFGRLAMFKGPAVSAPLLAIFWAGYLIATVSLATVALCQSARMGRRAG